MGSGLEMIIALVFGYLCGTIPFGLILTKSAGLGDIRTIGSGNIGATNVLRTGNKKVAALTLILDALKGTVPALLMGWLYGPEAGGLGGLAAFFGHLFPMWLGFKGGKGVATNIGVLFGLFWPLGLIFLAVWIVMALLFRISSLSALTASFRSPFAAYALGRGDVILPAVIMGAAIFVTHRANIARILNMYPKKGAVMVGSDPDLVIWDPKATKTITAKKQISRIEYNVFEGYTCTGVPRTVFSRGRIAWHEGDMRAKPGDGEFVRREPNAPVNVANAIWKGLTQPKPVARPDIVP